MIDCMGVELIMKQFAKNHRTSLWILLLGVFLVCIWQFPFLAPELGITCLVFSLILVISAVFKKQKEAYLQGKISRRGFIRNVLLEIIGLIFVMAIAGLSGGYIVEITTVQIAHDIAKFIAGAVIGFLVGISVGFLLKRSWDRFVKWLPTN
jgi:FtsH-binding integral membrane protein